MTYKTHMIGGAQAGILLAYANKGSPIESVLLFSTALFGSILPDIDYSQGKLARSDAAVRIISSRINKINGHRGITHTIPGIILLSFLAFAICTLGTKEQYLLGILSASIIFIVVHLLGGEFRRLAGFIAIIVFMMMPVLTSFKLSGTFIPALNIQTARLCTEGVFLGCLSHLIYDTFNSKGVSWLWPLTKRRIHVASIKSRSRKETLFVVMQILILALITTVCCQDLRIVYAIRMIIDEFAEGYSFVDALLFTSL